MSNPIGPSISDVYYLLCKGLLERAEEDFRGMIPGELPKIDEKSIGPALKSIKLDNAEPALEELEVLLEAYKCKIVESPRELSPSEWGGGN